MKISFAKYHGAGNDFILIDNRSLNISPTPNFVQRACDRRHGIGADGLLLLLPSQSADYRMRIFNADGSEPAMCGNGIRCMFQFIREFDPSELLRIETLSGVFACRTSGNEVAVNMGVPRITHWPIQLDQGEIYVVDTGVPHAVIFVEKTQEANVAVIGSAICRQFSPHGVNVNFVSLSPQGEVFLRTYERGVGETLACGTGAAATAYVAQKKLNLTGPISVATRTSFDRHHYTPLLRFHFSQNEEIEMVGEAVKVFEGEFYDHRDT